MNPNQPGSQTRSNQPSVRSNENIPNTSLDAGVKADPRADKKTTMMDDGPRQVQQRFSSLSLRDYYDSSALTVILSKGLEELARQRYSYQS